MKKNALILLVMLAGCSAPDDKLLFEAIRAKNTQLVARIASVIVWCIRRRSAPSAAFEIMLSATWLLALALAGFCLLSWQIQNVPIFSHMEWHY
jgi:hypothetical protein